MAFGFSPIIPLQKSEEDGYYALTKTIAANTKQNLKNLLLTKPGERVMLPDFGVGLQSIIFNNQHDSLQADITYRIEKQVATYLPFIVIDNIEFISDNETDVRSAMEHKVGIKIAYSVPGFSFADLLTISKIQFT